LADSLEDLDKQCAALAGATTGTFFGTPPSGKQPENFSTLNQHFGQLLGIADSADARPDDTGEQGLCRAEQRTGFVGQALG